MLLGRDTHRFLLPCHMGRRSLNAVGSRKALGVMARPIPSRHKLQIQWQQRDREPDPNQEPRHAAFHSRSLGAPGRDHSVAIREAERNSQCRFRLRRRETGLALHISPYVCRGRPLRLGRRALLLDSSARRRAPTEDNSSLSLAAKSSLVDCRRRCARAPGASQVALRDVDWAGADLPERPSSLSGQASTTRHQLPAHVS